MDNPGIMISCGGCGRMKHIDLKGTAEEIEQRIHEAIDTEGWRYAPRWKGYMCAECRKAGGSKDALYNAFFGRTRAASKANSYKRLTYDVSDQLQAFRDLDMMAGGARWP